MTEAELKVEQDYFYHERLALLGQFGAPTISEHSLALNEAQAIVETLRGYLCAGCRVSRVKVETDLCETCQALSRLKNTLATQGKLRFEREYNKPYAD